jgi:hypothetical protein
MGFPQNPGDSSNILLDIKAKIEKIIPGEVGGSFSGRTAGSGPANQGSNPCPPATMVPSSSGLGRRPLTPVTRVRVPLGLFDDLKGLVAL